MAGLLGDWSTGDGSDGEQNESNATSAFASSGNRTPPQLASRFSVHGRDVVSEFGDAFGERGATIRFASRSPSPPPSSFTRSASGRAQTTPTTTRRYISSSHEINELSQSPTSPSAPSPTNVAYRTEEGWHAGGDTAATSRHTSSQTEADSSFVTRTVSTISASNLGAYTGQTQSSTGDTQWSSGQTGEHIESSQPASSNQRRISGLSTLSSRGANEREQYDASSFQQAASNRSQRVSGGYSVRESGQWNSGDNASRYDDAEGSIAFRSLSTSRTGSFYTLSDAADEQNDYQQYSISNELAGHETPSTPSRIERETHTSRMGLSNAEDDVNDNLLMTPRRNLFAFQAESGVVDTEQVQHTPRPQESQAFSGSQTQSGSSFTSRNMTSMDELSGRQTGSETLLSGAQGQREGTKNNLSQIGERSVAGQELGTRTGTVKRISNTVDSASLARNQGASSSQDESISTQRVLPAPLSSQTALQSGDSKVSASASSNTRTAAGSTSSRDDESHTRTDYGLQSAAARNADASSSSGGTGLQGEKSKATTIAAGAGLGGLLSLASGAKISGSRQQSEGLLTTGSAGAQGAAVGKGAGLDTKPLSHSGDTAIATSTQSQRVATGQEPDVKPATPSGAQGSGSRSSGVFSTGIVGQTTQPGPQTQAPAQDYAVQPRETQGSVIVAQPTSAARVTSSSPIQARAQDYGIQARQTEGSVVVAQPTTSGQVLRSAQTQTNSQDNSVRPQQTHVLVPVAQPASAGQAADTSRTQASAQISDVQPGLTNGNTIISKPTTEQRVTSTPPTQTHTSTIASQEGTRAEQITQAQSTTQEHLPSGSLSRSNTQRRISRDAVTPEVESVAQISKPSTDKGKGPAVVADGFTASGKAEDSNREERSADKENVPLIAGSIATGGAIGGAVLDYARKHYNASSTTVNNTATASGSSASARAAGTGGVSGTSSSAASKQVSNQVLSDQDQGRGAQRAVQSATLVGADFGAASVTADFGAASVTADFGAASVTAGSSNVRQPTPASAPSRTPSQRTTTPISYEYFKSARQPDSPPTASQSLAQNTTTAAVIGSQSNVKTSAGKTPSSNASGAVFNLSDSKYQNPTMVQQRTEQGQTNRTDSAAFAGGLVAGGAATALTSGGGPGLPSIDTSSKTGASGIEASQPQPSIYAQRALGGSEPYLSGGKEATESPILLDGGIDEKLIHPFGEFKSEQKEEAKAEPKSKRPDLKEFRKGSINDEYGEGEEIARVGSVISRYTTNADPEEQAEISRLMSRMFGKTRQEHSEEEKTRHVGVVFKHLTVRGMGLGAALQASTGDIFLGLPRFVGNIFKRGPRKAAGKPPIKTIIQDFSGVIRPGEMCLVLGKPGSGCSTFLKVIGNQRFGYESIDGEVTYGGTDARTMYKNYRSEVLYNPEEDLHYATLTVKRTLEFALKCKTPGKESRNEGETAKDYVSNFLKAIVKLFWIEHTLETKVGNEYVRGVSGGEKKRVSIAEAMITKASIQCWDNSTRGLDASTALEYVSSIRSLTDMANISTAVALYQAGENLYKRFDKVLLIEGGRCCYFGDATSAAKYFQGLGFVHPDRWTTADFLTSVTDEHERHIREGWENRIPRTADEFGDAFMKSEQYRANLQEIEAFERETQELVAARHQAQGKATKRKNYTISFWRQIISCTHRQFLVMLGDRETLIGKWGGILFQALIIGSLFYNLPKTSLGVFPRGGVLFFMLLFNALLALSELTGAFISRPILLKHKSFQFYRPSAFAIAQTVVDVPLVLVQVFIFDIVVYFMADLSRTAGQFFSNLLFLFILTMTMYAFFRAIGALSGSLDSATKVTGVFIQAIIVYTGYLIPPTKMHPWFSWIRWINPVQYGFEALMAIEFHSLNITCTGPNVVPQNVLGGPVVSPQHQGCTLQGSQIGQTWVAGSDYIDTAYKYTYSHVWRNFGIIIGFFIFFVVVTAFGMELQRPNKGGGAVTIYKRGQVPDAFAKAMETGQEPADIEKGGSAKGAKSNWSEKHQTDSTGSNGSDSDEIKGVAGNETVFTWQNVNYSIPIHNGERQLLQDVQGYVRPGKLTALMGASGAGKTTLLNTLAQRITFGRVEGDFLVDGRTLPKSFQRSSGFAEQMDVHEPTATVREALRFSALLRQPREVPIEEKYAYCETILRLLEMDNIAGATVGKPGSGLNQEQRKRLTIGVELASKPELLMFLDEPTSGLDSQSAFNIVRLLRKLASAGQAILCTIHQPSAVLFEEFDELILLKAGGRIVYHGELGRDSRHMIDYFESSGGKKCSARANPAEYMLEVIGAGDPDYDGPDWGDMWAKSSERERRTHEIEEMVERRRNATADDALKDQREFAMPWWTQIYVVVYRNFVAYWRSPEYIIGKFILHITTGLFNAFTFWHLGNSSIDMQSRLFSVFMTITICPPLIQQLQPRLINLRSIYQSRERNSKIYGWYAFAWAAVLPELPYSFVAGTLYWCCWYWPTFFPRGTYPSVTVWLFVGIFEMFYVSFGQAIAAFAPNELLASILVPIFFTFVVSFCGVVVPAASLPYFWRSWMYDITPFRYLVEGMLAPLIHNVTVECADNELAKFTPSPGLTCDGYAGKYANMSGGYVRNLNSTVCGFCQYRTGDDFGASFNVSYSHVWRNYGFLYAFVVFNFVVVFLASYLYLGGGRKLMRWIRSRNKK